MCVSNGMFSYQSTGAERIHAMKRLFAGDGFRGDVSIGVGDGNTLKGMSHIHQCPFVVEALLMQYSTG